MIAVNLLEFSTTDTSAVNANGAAAIETPSPPTGATEPQTPADSKSSTFNVIPRFYHKLPRSNDILAQKLREEARTLFLQKRSRELLDNNELKTLWNILQKNYTPPSINNEHFVSYDDFLRVLKIAGDKFK